MVCEGQDDSEAGEEGGGQIIQLSVPMAGSLILRVMVKNQWCDGNQI